MPILFKGNIVNYNFGVRNMTTTEICEASSKLVNFIDLAGHEKYLKTTVFGLTGNNNTTKKDMMPLGPIYLFLLIRSCP